MKVFMMGLLVLGIEGLVGAQPSIQWQKTLGGSLYDGAESVRQTSDGGYIVAGTTVSDDGDVIGNHGYFDAWVIKLDSIGDLQWKTTYGASNLDIVLAITQANDGGYILVGFTESNDGYVLGNHGGRDAWIIKLDHLGNFQWQKCLGGSKKDEAWDIRSTPDGGYILAALSGSSDGDLTENNGSQDCWIVKLNQEGEIEWQRAFGGSNFDHAYTVSPTIDGGYIFAGESQSVDGDITEHHNGLDAWVVKLNFEGKIEWQRPLGGSSEDYGQSIWQTTDGGFIATGLINSNDGDVTGNHGSSDLWVIKLSEGGELLWQKAFGGSLQEEGYSIRQTTDGGYIVAGSAWSNDGDVPGAQGKTDFWIIKLSPETSPTTTPSTQTLQLYPNPTQNTLSIKLPTSLISNAALTLKLTDLLGREVLQKSGLEASLGSVDLDVSSLPGGVYLLQVSSLEGEIWVGKFQKLD